MPVNYYPQKTEAELLVILSDLQKRASSGALSMTAAAGLQQMKSWQGAAPVSVEIRRVLYSLWKVNPNAYENPYAQRVRRTRPSYTGDPGTTITLE